jgi:uncharacterized protein (DUF924 family)
MTEKSFFEQNTKMVCMLTAVTTIMLSVSEFAAKSFVKQAMASPMRPESVLSFFYGVDFITNDPALEMRQGSCSAKMSALWYGGGEEYDQLCQSFRTAVKAAGNQELKTDEWNSSVDGKVGQMLLCDQLSRNCFRGTDEAFAYDQIAEDLSLELTTNLMQPSETSVLSGEFYPPFISSCILPLMHSESLKSHQRASEIYDWVFEKEERLPKHLHGSFQGLRGYMQDHTRVLERFGRYPHRNSKLGRANTPEETLWLADTEKLPGWAKSQG